MSNSIISVENLSKSYLLKHKNTERYSTLRDALAKKVSTIFQPSQKPSIKKSEEFWALQDVSFEVQQGDRIGIIGRNGAGKSTLLKVLSRIVYPTKGRISIHGRVASLLEVGTGFHPELSGRENVFLNGSILGMSKIEIKRKFDEIVAFAEVEKFLDTPVKRYSSGMYVRLAFAVAAHLEPEILIVDEVLAVGDAEFQKKCLGKMKDVSGEGRTVLFVSHNMAAIQNLCDKAIYLKNGRTELIGESEKVISTYLKAASQTYNINLKDRIDRQGEGKIKITHFEFLNHSKELITQLITGQTILFKIYYESLGSSDLTNVTAAIAVYGDDGILYTVVGNEYSSVPFPNIPAKGTLICEIGKLPLAAGRYILNIAISQNGVMQDWIQEAVSFDIESGDYYGTGKVLPATHKSILIENTWKIS